MSAWPSNYSAVIIAAIVNFILGALWYSPLLFGGIWSKAVNQIPGNRGSAVLGFAMALITSLIAAYVVALVVFGVGAKDFGAGALVGAILAFAFSVTSHAQTTVFERRSLVLALINSFYALVGTSLMGGIIGAWR